MTHLQHDAAFALASVLLDIVRNCLREEEHRDAHNCFYEACKAALEVYDLKRERTEQRLRPSRN